MAWYHVNHSYTPQRRQAPIVAAASASGVALRTGGEGPQGPQDPVNTKGLPLLWLASTVPSCILPTRQRILTDNREQTTHIGHHEDSTGPRTFMSQMEEGPSRLCPSTKGYWGCPRDKSKPGQRVGCRVCLDSLGVWRKCFDGNYFGPRHLTD